MTTCLTGFVRLHRLALALLLAVFFSANVSQALAHAALVKSVPADGEVVAAAPAEFRLDYSEPVSPLVLRLIGPNGSSVTLDAVAAGSALTIAAPNDLAQGTHVLSWRVVSLDGHPIGGSLIFSIGAPSETVPHFEVKSDPAAAIALWAVKSVLYVGLFLGVGGAFFNGWIARERPVAKSAIAGFAMLGLAAVVLATGLQGLDALAERLPSLVFARTWTAGWETTLGLTAALAGVALIAALAALLTRGGLSRTSSVAGMVLAGLALAASGHASAASPQWLMRPAVFLHAVAIAFWVGALIPLGLVLSGNGGKAALHRFSAAIPFAIIALIASGATLAIVQVGAPQALWSTAYGRVFLVKLALLAVIFALAIYNRLWLTAPALAGDHAGLVAMRRSVAVETGLVIVVLCVVALWRFTPPPRILAVEAAMPAMVHIHDGKAMADVTVTPGRAGPVTVAAVVMQGDFLPMQAQEVVISLSNPAAGIEPIRRNAVLEADGAWRVEGLSLPVGGAWTIVAEILVSDFEKVTLDAPIAIRD